MLVDLVQTTTRDGLRLDGVYQAPPAPTGTLGVDAFLHVHGTGGNFYGSTLFDALAERFLAGGAGVLRINTRGHDLMSTAATASGSGRVLGAAYEVGDDCRHDLAAWVAWLKAKAGPRICLLGHSLGAVKCLYALAHEPDLAASSVVAVSPPRLSWSHFRTSERSTAFLADYNRAEQLVHAGEPETLIQVSLPLPMFITAGGFVEKYGPDERYNYLRFIERVRCPVLLTLGELEHASHMAFRGAAEALAGVAPGVRVEIVSGADHFYRGVRDDLVRRVEWWLGARQV
jgi:dipeptidyl aminopeptidase/acylaminoacyl peptidase